MSLCGGESGWGSRDHVGGGGKARRTRCPARPPLSSRQHEQLTNIFRVTELNSLCGGDLVLTACAGERVRSAEPLVY